MNKSKELSECILFLSFKGRNTAGKLDYLRFRNQLSEYSKHQPRYCLAECHENVGTSFRSIILRSLRTHSNRAQVQSVLFIMPSLKDLFLLLLIQLLPLARIRVVAVIHNAPFHPSSSNAIKNLAINALQFLFYSLSNKVVFLSSSVSRKWMFYGKSFINYKLPLNYCLPTTSSRSLLVTEPKSLKYSLDSEISCCTKKCINLLVIGKYLPYKDLDLLTASLSLISKQKSLISSLSVMGSGYPISQIKKISQVCKDLSINFNYSPCFVDDAILDSVMLNFDYTVFLYKSASQSGLLQRSLELGIPVICSDVGGFSEQLSGSRGFCLKPEPSLIAQTLACLPKSPPTHLDCKDCSFTKPEDLLKFIFAANYSF